MPREQLSALLDGECTGPELDALLQALERSPELKHTYSRLCVAREAAEGTRIVRSQISVCEGVMARLAQETMDPAPSPRVVDLDTRRRWFTLRSVGGLAAAASVAAIAVLVALPGLRDPAGNELAASASGLMPQVSVPAVQSVSMPGSTRTRGLRSVALSQEELDQMDELNNLLIEHSSTLAEQGVGGTLRYARFAAHSAPARVEPAVLTGDQR